MPDLTPHEPLTTDVSLETPTGRRIASLWFPYWLSETHQGDFDPSRPLVLVEMQNGAQRVVAATPVAEAAGLFVGMSLSDARALVADLQTAIAAPDKAREKLAACAEWLQRYTPWVGHDAETEAPQNSYGLLLDMSGCAHLFGGERRLLEDMTRLFNARGITLRTAIAGTVGAAWGLARYSTRQMAGAPVILPPQHEADAMLPLPPAALRLNAHQLALCQKLGLTSVAQLAAFERAALTRRFGHLPVLRMEQAFGQVGEAVNPCLPPPQFLVQRLLPQGVTQLPAIVTLVEQICQPLAAQLQDAGQGAQRLDLAMTRSDNAVLALSVKLAHPSASPRHMGRLFAERLERLKSGIDAGFGIEKLVLGGSQTTPLAPPQTAMGLHGRHHAPPPASALGHLFDRLVSRLGAKTVVRPVTHASYVPERAVGFVSVLAQAPHIETIPPEAPALKTRPLFMLCAAEPIEVIAEIPEGAPYRFRWRRVLHEVVAAYGPERISPEWWQEIFGQSLDSHNRQTRDYFRVEDTHGHRFWLYRGGLYGRETQRPQWFMHGVFS